MVLFIFRKKRIIYILVLSFLIGLYSFFWVGWWYIFDILALSILFYGLASFLIKRERRILSSSILDLILIFSFSLLFVSVFLRDLRIPFDPLLKPFSILTELKSPLLSEFWPNTYLTVGELKEANIFGIVNSVNGWFLFLLSIFGVIWLILKEQERRVGIFLFLWILVSLYSSQKGIRFSILLLSPVSICSGIGAGRIYNYLGEKFKEKFPKGKMIFGLLFLSLHTLRSLKL